MTSTGSDDADFINTLALQRSGALSLFFASMGLGDAYERPGAGWGPAKRIAEALAEARSRGTYEEVIQAARRQFDDTPEASEVKTDRERITVGVCFVIQPFDQGPFDKRYDDVLSVALRDAGLEPYRVDRDPAASIPIDAIAMRIRDADVCLADISLDNPNVWFELGLAIAAGRELILICDDGRERFPFDVQHRNIIRYKTDSTRDFDELREKVKARAMAALEASADESSIRDLAPLSTTEGLSPHEQAFLVLTAQRMDSEAETVPAAVVRQSMQRAGFNDLAVTLAFRALSKKRLIETELNSAFNEEPWNAYRVLDAGFDWLEANRDSLSLRSEGPEEAKAGRPYDDPVVGVDDIPF